MEHKIVIGKEEWCALHELGLPAVKARIDSGAKTSSLHAFNIYPFEEDGKRYVILIFILFRMIAKPFSVAKGFWLIKDT